MYKIDFQKPIRIHFIGIGGISMSGLAEILLEEGFTVSGSDAKESPLTRKLESEGAHICYGQKAENITDDIDCVVYTAAIRLSRDLPGTRLQCGHIRTFCRLRLQRIRHFL